jgi:hypothetical protein
MIPVWTLLGYWIIDAPRKPNSEVPEEAAGDQPPVD